jgi:hypothetical protein
MARAAATHSALALGCLLALTAPQFSTAAFGGPPSTQIPEGGACNGPSDCASDYCVDGVCCDTACNGPAESCNQDGHEGTCSPLPAPAPPLSRKGLFSVIALLTAFGVLSFSRRRRLGAAATHG